MRGYLIKELFAVIVLFTISFAVVSQSFQAKKVSNYQLSSVFMIDNTIGYAAGVDGIYKTANGAQTWNLLPYFVSTLPLGQRELFTDFNEQYLYFKDASVGYSVGWNAFTNSEEIIKTTDGGATWQVQHYFNPNTDIFQPLEERLKDITVLQSGVAYAVGHYGRILKSEDGTTWQVVSLPTSASLDAIQFIDNNTGFIGGDGILIKTTDGGITWKIKTIDFSISDIYFFTASSAIAVTQKGQILTTTDGGNVWVEQLTHYNFPLNKINFIDANTGFICAGHINGAGYILKTTDRGVTWLNVLNSNAGFSNFSSVSIQDVYFSDWAGSIWSSHDGGSKTIVAPTITDINPNSGKAGDLVTISGTSLDNVTSIYFNGLASSFTYLNPSTVTAQVPLDATTGKISLQWPGGNTLSQTDYTVSLQPFLKRPEPYLYLIGSPLILEGANLQYTTSVKLDSREMPFTILDNHHLSVPVDSDLFARKYEIIVTSSFGNAYLSFFPFYKIPQIGKIYSSYGTLGIKGQELTVEGINLGCINRVEFENGVAVPVSPIEYTTSLKFLVPDRATSGTLKFYYPSGVIKSSIDLSIIGKPQIDSIKPLNVKAGEVIHVYGKNLIQNSELINDFRVGPYGIPDFKFISENRIDLLAPSVQVTGPISISLFNGGTVSTESITINGTLPYFISKVEPLIATNNSIVNVFGVLPPIDSVFIGNVKVPTLLSTANTITVKIPNGATSGRVRVYSGNTSITSDSTVIISSTEVPIIVDFNPKIVSPESYVNLLYKVDYPDDDIVDFSLNGMRLPFTYKSGRGSIENAGVQLKIPLGATSGRIRLRTKHGDVMSEDALQLRPNSGPIIHGYWHNKNVHTGNELLIFGSNLSEIDSVQFDNISASFTVRSADTIMVEIPDITRYEVYSTRTIVVKSPYGNALTDYQLDSNPRQRIKTISPMSAQRGEAITVTLEEPKPYFSYYGEPMAFYFNGVKQKNFVHLSGNDYLVEVPLTGNVNGKIGVEYYPSVSSFELSTSDFTVIENSYCPAGGRSPIIFGIAEVKLGGFRNPSSANAAYSDYTNIPIDVVQGQELVLTVKFASNFHTSAAYHVSAFADWNNDLDFNDEGELLFQAPWQSSASDTLFFTKLITIPLTAIPLSSTRLRISTNGGFDYALNETKVAPPCGMTYNGEVEDYQLFVNGVGGAIVISDFYPKTVAPGNIVRIAGNGLMSVMSATIGGIPASSISYFNDTLLEIEVPSNAPSGKIVLSDMSWQTIESSSRLTVVDEIPVISESTFSKNFLYRATLNGNDIPFTYSQPFMDLYNILNLIIPSDAESGIACVYGSSGKYCYSTPYKFTPTIDSIAPVSQARNQKVVIRGSYLTKTTKVTFNGLPSAFTQIDANTIEAIVPETATTGPIEVTCLNGVATSLNYFVVPTDYCAAEGYGNTNIVDVQAGTFEHSSAVGDYRPKQIDPGLQMPYSDYTSLLIPMTGGQVIDFKITVKGVLADFMQQFANVYIDWNNDFDFSDSGEHFISSDFVNLAYGTEDVALVKISVPDTFPVLTKLRLRITFSDAAYNFDAQPCFSMGEIEDYTIAIQPSASAALKPVITDFSPKISAIGSIVRVTGSNFNSVSSTSINGVNSSFTLIDNQNLDVRVAAGTTSGFISLVSPEAVVSSSVSLTVTPPFSISTFTPSSGQAGDEVTIQGTSLNQAAIITFNDLPSEFVIVNSNQIKAKAPLNAGDGYITIYDTNGSQAKSAAKFSYCDGLLASSTCKQGQFIYMNDFNSLPLGSTLTPVAIASSHLPVTFSSSDPAIAAISNGEIVGKSTGSVTITATQIGNAQFFSSVTTRVLNVTKGTQTIKFPAIPPRIFGDVPFTPSVTSNSAYPIILQSSNPNVATISGSSVSIVGAGTANITASQPENNSYFAAASVTQPLSVSKADQSIAFDSIYIKTIGDLSFNLSATSSSGLPVTFNSSDNSIATISGYTVTIKSAGNVKITATQAGNSNINPAHPVIRTLTVSKKSQTISFNPLPQKAFGDSDFTLTASSSSGLPIYYVSSDPTIAQISSGGVVTIIKPGTVSITASQPGNNNYLSAVPAVQDLIISKGQQLISFSALPEKAFGDNDFILNGTASSGLPVTYTSSDPTIAQVSGNVVKILGAGNVTITASQDGDLNFFSAMQVDQLLIIRKRTQSINFAKVDDKIIGDIPFELQASASSQLPIEFSTSSTNISINNNLVTILGAGFVNIAAHQDGNVNFEAAPIQTQSFCVNPVKPIITVGILKDGAILLTSDAPSGNQWYLNGEIISGAIGVTYDAVANGSYTVVVSEGICASTSDTKDIFVTSIDPQHDHELELFPIPSDSRLFVESKNQKIIDKIEVLDMTGRLLLTRVCDSPKTELDVSSFSSGQYILKVGVGTQIFFKKFGRK